MLVEEGIYYSLLSYLSFFFDLLSHEYTKVVVVFRPQNKEIHFTKIMLLIY